MNDTIKKISWQEVVLSMQKGAVLEASLEIKKGVKPILHWFLDKEEIPRYWMDGMPRETVRTSGRGCNKGAIGYLTEFGRNFKMEHPNNNG